MAEKHKHDHCNHEGHLHFCSHCGVVYCDVCNKEWPEKVTIKEYIPNPTPYTVPRVTWGASNIDFVDAVSHIHSR